MSREYEMVRCSAYDFHSSDLWDLISKWGNAGEGEERRYRIEK